ncbi:MAG: BTAD domain-containing putative transcriptional regulator [Gemmatimonadota bacterium]
MYTLKLLGGATLEDHGRPLAGRIVQRRRLALLALLASSNGRPASREKLIAHLWPERGTSAARHLLSDSVHVIRKSLGDGAVLVEGDGFRLNPAVMSSDVAEFAAALAAGDLERSVGLYAGPFLDGFFIGGEALEFESWAASERERLALSHASALERLAESAAAGGRPRRAADWWRRLCAEEPDNSRFVLGLMTALATAGDRASALRQAEEHAEYLQSEYGAEPDPTVTAFVRRLQEAPDAWVAPAVVISGLASGGAPAKPARPAKPAKPTQPAKLTQRSRRAFAPRQAVLGAGVAAAMVLLAAFYVERWQHGPEFTPEEAQAAAANAASGIAVLPFTVNDPAFETWGEGMAALLSVNLDGVPDLRAIDNRTVLARWEEAVPDTVDPDLATSLAVAGRSGARYALLGSVVVIGTDMRLTAHVYEVRGGTKLGQVQVAGAPDSVLTLVDRLTMEVLRGLPREAGGLADLDHAELTTDSLAALKAFLNGEDLYRRGDLEASAAAYERAIASDSTFALAGARLAGTCRWKSGSEPCGEGDRVLSIARW